MLSRELAAAYTGVSLRQFDEECAQKLWPASVPRGGVGSRKPRKQFDRLDLDATVDGVLKGMANARHASQNKLGDFEARRQSARLRRRKNG